MSKAVKKIANVATLGLASSILEPGKAQGTANVEATAAAPTAVSEETQSAREALRKRQLAAAGLGGTMLTGAGGLASSANTAGKSLLGS